MLYHIFVLYVHIIFIGMEMKVRYNHKYQFEGMYKYVCIALAFICVKD
jgi:hypothetical protein